MPQYIDNTVYPERAILILPISKSGNLPEKKWFILSEGEKEEEFKKLVESSGCIVTKTIKAHLHKINPSCYIGTGKAEEITAEAQALNANVAVFNCALTPSQQGNLEDLLQIKVIDRIQLILDIFAKHAHSAEGRLQVELAQLKYLLPRLKGKGIMLSRLGGGIGTRGPGEKKLEVERRRLTDRISTLKKELSTIETHHSTIRKQKTIKLIPTVSLVGYTSAGKSTILNALTKSSQKTEESFFTTLDTISRQILLPSGKKAVLTDTVGFISDLPVYLIESFNTTLKELQFASVLLHVVDISSRNINAIISSVNQTIETLGLKDKPQIMVFNKIDLLEGSALIKELRNKFENSVFISALNNKNLDELLLQIEDELRQKRVRATIEIPMENASLFHHLYEYAEVERVEYKEKSAIFFVKIEEISLQKVNKKIGSLSNILIIN